MDHPRTRRAPRAGAGRARGSLVVRLVLAGGALVGLGAVATAAAWTNPAIATGPVTGASVGLQGRLGTTGTWIAADTDVSGVAVDMSAGLTDLTPGATKTSTIGLRNGGNAKLTLSAPTVTKTGALFTGSCVLAVTTTGPQVTTLAAGTTTTMTVKVDAPASLPVTCWNKAGTLVVTVVGTATP